MSSKKKSRRKGSCPYPNCVADIDHDGDHVFRLAKGGRKRGPTWTAQLRAFVNALKEGKPQTEAARCAKYKNPAVMATRLMKNPLVIEAMMKHASIQREAEQKVANKQAEVVGVRRSEIFEILIDIARNGESESARVRAAMGLAELKGMRINRNLDVSKEYEGRTEEELEFFAVNGYWPEENESVEQGRSGPPGTSSGSTKAR